MYAPAIAPPGLSVDDLFGGVRAPEVAALDLLNEVALRYPDAVSFAAGQPYEGFLDLDAVRAHLDTFVAHLRGTAPDEAAARRTLLQYGRTKGIIQDLVARHLLIDEGIDADPESIVLTAGAQEAIFLVLRTLRRDDADAVLAVRPGYVGLTGAARLADLRVLPVRAGSAGVDLRDLADAVGRARAAGLRPRALYLNADFANPTGHSLDRPTRLRLLHAAADLDLLLLEDNPYGIFTGERGSLPTLRALDRADRVVYLGSFAKSGFPGARIGYAVAGQRVDAGGGRRETLADQVAKTKSMLGLNTSPIGQAVIGGKLLAHGLSLRAANRREIDVYRRNLRLALAGLAERFPPGHPAGVSWNRPEGGFFLTLRVPFPAGDDLLELSAREFGVLWTPMHHFHGDGRPRPRIRLSISNLEPGDIATGLDRLAAFVAARAAP
ncbi:aminotransferase [Pilimelia anulata]|uniref:Aminotransferase n=1 Tax=Pilimelia anulata TaxID=53371 RepID=A0A8J3B359_9ACTN|nr:PLP-dependent aminotransferase family protein [Pilimelia anulata]GGJ92436.1 aminotransferase [Pilimelia anulata]